MTSLQSLTQKALNNLTKNQRTVIESRYGLNGGSCLTLERIGKNLKLTRERIRQIENSVLEILRKEEYKQIFVPVVEVACNHLNALGGVRQENIFLDEVVHLIGEEPSKRNLVNNRLEFIFSLHGSPKRLAENNKFYAVRYIDTQSLSKVKKFLSSLEKITNKVGQAMGPDDFLNVLQTAMKENRLTNTTDAAYFISISKKFKINPYGDFGLRKWESIEPRGVREKAYLVMNKKGSPMHFSDISNEINKMKFDEKKAHPQTVHNELIKDTRFVLCGRGMYGLTSWGLEPGTVKDVIKKILKKNGPLPTSEVVKLVKEQRIVKDATVLLGLQDKDSFHKLDDDKYRIRTA